MEINRTPEMDNIFNKFINEAGSNIFLLYRSEVEALNYIKEYEFKDGGFKLVNEVFYKKK
ncbi:hypothetical protein [Acinetobacter baumannii]|uniref:hypothetical protein n=1 Tax=Acinetobacter baumannii TaxID=470 RepID=UPI001D17C106|nr:hypothetical protein [Acinetobacter baumannii]